MPLHSTLVAASAAFDAVSSNLVRLFERALSAFPIAGPHLSTYADIPAYSLLFLASNAAVVWPIHFACRFMDRHPNGWWFRYKINGAKRPPAKLEEESGKGAVWGRLVVGPIQEAIVYTLLYRSILRVNMTGMPGLFTFAKRFAIAVLWTDSSWFPFDLDGALPPR